MIDISQITVSKLLSATPFSIYFSNGAVQCYLYICSTISTEIEMLRGLFSIFDSSQQSVSQFDVTPDRRYGITMLCKRDSESDFIIPVYSLRLQVEFRSNRKFIVLGGAYTDGLAPNTLIVTQRVRLEICTFPEIHLIFHPTSKARCQRWIVIGRYA